MLPFFIRTLLLACAAALAVGGVSAATLEITVRDDDGAPVAGERIFVSPVSPEVDPRRRQRRGVTGQEGRATFSGLPPGQYRVHFTTFTDPLLVAPSRNPRTPQPIATLAGDQDRVALAIVLARGALVVCRMNVDRGAMRPAKVRFREVDHRESVELILRDDTDHEIVLAPGRWEAMLETPQGHLLVGVAVNGNPVEGSRPIVDVRRHAAPSYLEWELSARAQVTGRVDFEGPRVGIMVVATLVEPGPWIDATRRRGGSRYQSVRGGLDARDHYRMVLPDGRWKVRITGVDVRSTEPEAAEIVLEPGGEERVDFTVRGEPGNRETSLRVWVVPPDGQRRLGNAVVEVWPLDPGERGEQPAGRGLTGARGYRPAQVRGVGAGDYVVAAAHAAFLEGTLELTAFEPDPEEPREITVRLKRAAEIHARVTGPGDAPQREVRLFAEPLEEPPETIVRDRRIAAERSQPESVTDETGHGKLQGLWPGEYRLRGELRGAADGFVRFPDGDDLLKSLELDLDPGEKRAVTARVVPAARLAGTLACEDEGTLPGTATLLVLPAAARGSDEERELADEELRRLATIVEDNRPLQGDERDRFVVGPLDEGAYEVAVLPAGFERWTWAPGEERRSRATTYAADLGEPVDVGIIEIDCLPAVRLAPTLRTRGGRLPDLSDVHPRRGSLEIRGTVTRAERRREVDHARVDAFEDSVLLRGLPEGQARLQVTLVHRYFLPRPELVVPVEGTLRRGHTLTIRPPVPAVGGALRVRSADGGAARLTLPDGALETRPLTEGEVEFPSLRPGRYRVELCGDAACDFVRQSWTEVPVVSLETTTLRAR